MSNQWNPQSPYPPHNNRGAKIKIKRPWYKLKRVIIPSALFASFFGLIILLGTLAAIGGSVDTSPVASGNDSVVEGDTSGDTEFKPYVPAEDKADEEKQKPAPAEDKPDEASKPVAKEPVVQAPEPKPKPEPEPRGTVSQQNALESAGSYLEYSAFSRSGLIDQLTFEGFSAADAKWAVDNVTVNWSDQAVKSAEDYLEYSAFSRTGLIEQLTFEGFSTKDATRAADKVTVNWNEQAAKSAKSYLEYSAFSRQGLIDQLIFEGYTPAQAQYGVNQVGL